MFIAATTRNCDVDDLREVTLAVALLLLLVQRLHRRYLLGRLSLHLRVHFVR